MHRRRRRGKGEETAKCEVYFETIIKVYSEAIMAVLDSRLESVTDIPARRTDVPVAVYISNL